MKSTRGSCRFDIVAGQQGDSESVLIRGLDSYAEGPFIASDALNITPSLDCLLYTSQLGQLGGLAGG